MLGCRWQCGAWLGVLALLQGCAHVYVDPDGTRNIVGLVWLKLPPPDGPASAGGALRTRSVGLSLTRSDVGSAMVLGYSDSTLAYLRNDVAVPASALRLGDAAATKDPLHATDPTRDPGARR